MSEPPADAYRRRFRGGPAGLWRAAVGAVTVEVAFAPDGSGLGRFVGAGGGEDRWRFDWSPAGERAILVRRVRPDRGPDGWDVRADEPDVRFAEPEGAVRFDFAGGEEPELFEVGRDGFLGWPCRFRLVGAPTTGVKEPVADRVGEREPGRIDRTEEPAADPLRRGILFLFWIAVVVAVTSVVVGMLGR
jgi:hypothetical protein